MQRYPAKTPPLHHPVPQHPVSVPVMHSPPPPPSTYDSPYGAPSYAQSENLHPASAGQYGWPPNMGIGSGGIFADPTAQMGFSVAKAAMSGGQDYAEKNFTRYLSSLKPYFAVTNTYVLHKLHIILNPWRHTPWSRQSSSAPSASGNGQEFYYLPPREDINAPDMYIPLMSFVTYILLSALLSGLKGNFHPELLGYNASTAFAIVVFEIVCLKLGCHLLSINSQSQLLDLVAYSGYKFVGIIVAIAVASIVGNGVLGWVAFAYCFAANAFFLLRSLKYVLRPDSSSEGSGTSVYPGARSQKKWRTWFLFGYSYIVQFFFMLILTSGVGGKA
ncbi:hypothetical protein RUND412_000501 [Rhizina undulata]